MRIDDGQGLVSYSLVRRKVHGWLLELYRLPALGIDDGQHFALSDESISISVLGVPLHFASVGLPFSAISGVSLMGEQREAWGLCSQLVGGRPWWRCCNANWRSHILLMLLQLSLHLLLILACHSLLMLRLLRLLLSLLLLLELKLLLLLLDSVLLLSLLLRLPLCNLKLLLRMKLLSLKLLLLLLLCQHLLVPQRILQRSLLQQLLLLSNEGSMLRH